MTSTCWSSAQDPGGQKAAIAAAKLDRQVAVVERPRMLGGVCLNTGTIPSKTLSEAVLYLTGLDQREMYGQAYRVKDEITIADLTARTQHVVGRESDVVRSQLVRNGVTILAGTGRFTGPNTVEVTDDDGRMSQASAKDIVIATGTRPARPDERRLRREDDHRRGRGPARGAGSAVDAGGGRRGDRHRVRVDVRRPGHQGHGRGAARADAGVLRPGGRRGPQVPPARSRGDVPVRRDRHLGRGP